MRRIFALFAVLGAVMMMLTGCGESGFDGKWDCVEAEVDTYGGALAGAYDAIEQNGVVSLLCVVEIDGGDVKYAENSRDFKVSNVNRSGKTITFTVTGSYGVTDTVTLKLKDEGKTIIATRDENVYTLERSDFYHKVIAAIPFWVYLILGGFLLLVIVGKIFAAKDRAARKKAPGSNVPPQFRTLQSQYQQPQQPQYQQPQYQQPQQPQPYYDPENPFQNP